MGVGRRVLGTWRIVFVVVPEDWRGLRLVTEAVVEWRRRMSILVCCSPVLSNVEAPLELEMSLLVVIDEARVGRVMAAGEHAAGGLFLGDWFLRSAWEICDGLTRTNCIGYHTLLLVDRVLLGVGSEAALL